MIKIISPFSAIPSWEGFEYQGHIALFIVLKHIWHEIELGNREEINLYKLGIEGEEDFSIIKDGNYVSLHQIKAGKIDLCDSDKACFILSALQYEAENAYFHIIPQASISFDFVDKTVKHIEKLITELNKEVKTKKEFSDEIKKLETSCGKEIKKSDVLYKQTEGKYIVTSNITANAPKGSIHKILDFVCAGNKEKQNVIKVIEKVVPELSLCRDKLQGKCDSDMWKIYDKRFTTSAEVIENSCKIIEKILKKINPEGSIYYDEIYYQFVYDELVLFIKKVIREHNTQSKKNSCKISFLKLFDLIVKDYKAESNTTEYMYYELLQLIKDTFKKYPNSIRTDCIFSECEICKTTNECNLYRQMMEIDNKSYRDKKDFLYKLLLRTPKNNLPRGSVINNLLITLLKRIECLRYCDSNVILAKKDEEIYRLTLDENEYIEDFEDQLKKELHENHKDKFLIYESDVLITDRLNKLDYRYNQINFNVMGSEELNEIADITSDSIERQKINCNKSKIVRIISKDVAEEELNNHE
ncbi:MAG: hypothetical protein HFK00_01550 [Oscillospiraceae bacterium]|nr:hypothetical protein [Oscillospiraceae bacterium]